MANQPDKLRRHINQLISSNHSGAPQACVSLLREYSPQSNWGPRTSRALSYAFRSAQLVLSKNILHLPQDALQLCHWFLTADPALILFYLSVLEDSSFPTKIRKYYRQFFPDNPSFFREVVQPAIQVVDQLL
jgi:hypothetical protein